MTAVIEPYSELLNGCERDFHRLGFRCRSDHPFERTYASEWGRIRFFLDPHNHPSFSVSIEDNRGNEYEISSLREEFDGNEFKLQKQSLAELIRQLKGAGPRGSAGYERVARVFVRTELHNVMAFLSKFLSKILNAGPEVKR